MLVEEYGFKRVAFADKLREVLYALNPKIGSVSFGQGTRTEHHTVQTFIDKFGWDGYKENDGYHNELAMEVRRLLQRLGTEAGRQTLWDTIWIDAALTGIESDKIVVTDGRFYNEFDAVRARGGEIWRIDRDGVGPANDHASEIEAISYPHFSVTIKNNGTLEEFQDAVKAVYQMPETDGERIRWSSMNDTDRAWAAGFWDGEGCVSLTHRAYGYSSNPIPRIVLQIAQVDRRVLDKFQRIMGYGNVLGPYKPKTKNSSPYYVWRVEGNKNLQPIFELLAPYLSEAKTEQMQRALDARRYWEETATCQLGHRLSKSDKGNWRCFECQSEKGKKNAAARWSGKGE